MSDINCIRKECIENPKDSYHYEGHICFVCGAEFDPTVELLEKNLCPVCHWYKCPVCEGCKCSLSSKDQEWIDNIHNTYCRDIHKIVQINVSKLSETGNPSVKRGLGLQLYFCRTWALTKIAEDVRKED